MSNRLLIFFIVATIVASFISEFWPLAVVAVVAMGFVGKGLLAPVLGLLLDLAYGTPPGVLAYVLFPCALLGLSIVFIRYGTGSYFIERSSLGRL